MSYADYIRRRLIENPLTTDMLDSEVDAIKTRNNLRTLDAQLLGSGDIRLNMILVDPSDRKLGTGSKAMQELCAFADQYGRRIELSPATRSDGKTGTGTTSRDRLVRWYRRFGFRENKGKKIDFTTSAGMIRDPKPR